MTCVLWLIHVLYILRWLPTKPLQRKELWTPMHLSDHEGVCGGQSLELAPVPSQCQAACTVAGHTHSIWDVKWPVKSFLKGCMVLQLGKGLLFL